MFTPPRHRSPSRRVSTRRPADGPALQPLEGRQLLWAAAGPVAVPQLTVTPAAYNGSVVGFTPAQTRAAYGFTAPFVYGGTSKGTVNADGSGQTIAVVDAYNDPDIASDLSTFDSEFGLQSASLTVVNQYGSTSGLPAQNGAWAQEQSLDVEWAHAIAPGANILLVQTNSDSINDLLAGVTYARGQSAVSVVSMSWGVGEFGGETGYDSDFTTPSGHNGIAYVAAAGDGGTGSGVMWPAASPHVLGVGGTSLTLSGNNYGSETVWSDTGGGTSQYEAEPAYQDKVQSSGYRTVPDVAYDSNPNTGFAVYDSDSYQGNSGWLKIGGTSAATPQWSGLIAISDQGRYLYGGQNLQGDSSVLPTLYNTYGTSTYGSTFHDITSGNSGSIYATSGYDRVTGLGTPYARGVVTALVTTHTFNPLANPAAVVATAAVAHPADRVADVTTPTTPATADAKPTATAAAPTGPTIVTVAVTPSSAGAAVPPANVYAAATLTSAAPAVVAADPFTSDDSTPAVIAAAPLPAAADVAPVVVAAAPSPLSSFTLGLPAAVTPVAPTSSFATMLADSARSLRPVALAAAAGVAVAWIATGPARDRRRATQDGTATPFADGLIGPALLRM